MSDLERVLEAAIHDEKMPCDALGVLCYLVRVPAPTSTRELMARFDCGKDRMQRIINDLIRLDYLIREQLRDADDNTYGGVRFFIALRGRKIAGGER